MTNPILQSRFEALKTSGLLPSPKGVALAVVGLTHQDNASTAQLVHAIEADPALVARLIKLANNCQLPGARTVLAIKDAVNLLGLRAVRGLALGFSLMAERHLGQCKAFDHAHFWSRNLARAVAMRGFSARTRLIQSDEAFTLGLLSHVGELGLASLYPEQYAALLQTGVTALPGEPDLLTRERQAFDFDHADLTAALLQDWGFPQSLIAPIVAHETAQPDQLRDGSRTTQIMLSLMLSNQAADVCLSAPEQRRAMMAPLMLLGSRLSIESDELMTLCDAVVQDWTRWCALLDVPAQSLPAFADLMDYARAEDNPTQGKMPESAVFRVLLVDDDPVTRSFLNSILTQAGYLCLEAANGQQGLALADSVKPDLMIVDWMMPQMDGIELVRRLRQSPQGRAIYVLLLTSHDQIEKLREAFAAGVDDFLSKPAKPQELLARLIAGQRVVNLHREIKRDQTDLTRFATEFAKLNARLAISRQENEALESKQAQAELLRSNHELEQFSYSISHDMRQPLRMISSYMQLLQKGLVDQLDDEQRTQFGFAIEGARRMDSMMLGLLEYSRVGRKGEPAAWIHSRTVLDDALHFLQPALLEAKAHVHVQGTWPQIFVSPDEMLRLLQNLIGNALKFRQNGHQPHISIVSELTPQHWRVCIADDGIGMAANQISRLFQMFARLQSRTAFEGTGIGLALCRKIVEHHDGRIWAESDGEGRGSRFYIELPPRIFVKVKAADTAP